MKHAFAYGRECLRFFGGDSATITILVAVLCAAFFGFALGAAAELVGILLVAGVVTAVVEARLRVKAGWDRDDASRQRQDDRRP